MCRCCPPRRRPHPHSSPHRHPPKRPQRRRREPPPGPQGQGRAQPVSYATKQHPDLGWAADERHREPSLSQVPQQNRRRPHSVMTLPPRQRWQYRLPPVAVRSRRRLELSSLPTTWSHTRRPLLCLLLLPPPPVQSSLSCVRMLAVCVCVSVCLCVCVCLFGVCVVKMDGWMGGWVDGWMDDEKSQQYQIPLASMFSCKSEIVVVVCVCVCVCVCQMFVRLCACMRGTCECRRGWSDGSSRGHHG